MTASLTTAQEGSTPLHVAAEGGHSDVVKELLQRGANKEARRNEDVETPLYAAVKNGHLKVVQELLNSEADVNVKYKDDATPLHMAAEGGHLEVVKALLRKGANKEASLKTAERTPLHHAVENGQEEMVACLLTNGADVDALDKWLDKQQLANSQPADKQPADKQPANSQPADKQPADKQPADKQPADKQPADKQPADKQPADKQPADKQPADKQPADKQPADEQPADKQPVNIGGKTPLQFFSAQELEAANVIVRHMLKSEKTRRAFLGGEDGTSVYAVAFRIFRSTVPSGRIFLLALGFLITSAWLQFALLSLILKTSKPVRDGEDADNIILVVFSRIIVLVYITGVAETDCLFKTDVQTESFRVTWKQDEGKPKEQHTGANQTETKCDNPPDPPAIGNLIGLVCSFIRGTWDSGMAGFGMLIGLMCPIIQAATALFAIYVTYAYLNNNHSVTNVVLNGVGISFVLSIDDMFGSKLVDLTTDDCQNNSKHIKVFHSKSLWQQKCYLYLICRLINIAHVVMTTYCLVGILDWRHGGFTMFTFAVGCIQIVFVNAKTMAQIVQIVTEPEKDLLTNVREIVAPMFDAIVKPASPPGVGARPSPAGESSAAAKEGPKEPPV
ncbi:hypothetical protein GPECTOR_304g828 [Gonium pectorale]|uniref:Uncharacterized protein n=1 Tax=Gonium pectorale TaxID=33097 RepID=A0A150FVU1_GONPE|nr:hypothetical protein GPECTOR_304g828 [Gonium pectorale]|eukprot:KXZ41726.1 hypothetical protein GPECTOR_304g828 [Gonium pectorale]